MSAPVRVGILGLGSIGRTHAAALSRLDGAAQVVAASGDSAAALAEAGWPAAEHMTDAQELAARSDLDIVLVATPSDLHAGHAAAAIDAGHDVVVEKPLATSTADAAALLRLAEERGRTVYPVAQRRLEPQHRHIRAQLDAGTLGHPVLGEIFVHWHRDAAYYAAAPWRSRMPAGGSLMNQGLHSVDLLSWFLGPITAVTAQTATLGNGGEAEDTATVTLEAASGALGVAVTTTAAPPGDPAVLSLRTTSGVIELAHTDVVRWEVGEAPPPPSTSSAGAGSADPAAIGLAGHVDVWRDVLDARAAGRPPSVRAVDGWRTVALIDAAYRSARTGTRVTVPSDPDTA